MYRFMQYTNAFGKNTRYDGKNFWYNVSVHRVTIPIFICRSCSKYYKKDIQFKFVTYFRH